MSDSGMLIKSVAFIALIAVFTISLGDWDVGAPDVDGWASFTTTITSDPWSGTPAWPTFPTIDEIEVSCDWWDIVCWGAALAEATAFIGSAIVYFGLLIYTGLVWIIDGLIWLASVVVAFTGGMFSIATLTYDDMPAPVQVIMWLIIAPLLAIVILAIIRYIRGVD